MGAKSIIGVLLILIGIVGLIIGAFGIFGRNLTTQSPWMFAVLGLIFSAPASV